MTAGQSPIGVQVHGIPDELKVLRQWVNWRSEIRDGKPTKVPYLVGTSTRASATNPSTWRTFEDAVAAHQVGGYTGIGFVFTEDDPFVGVDIDKCRDPQSGQIEPGALYVVRWLASYTELSVSGTGLHIIVKGRLPPGGRRKGRIEMYDRARYFALTGHRLESIP